MSDTKQYKVLVGYNTDKGFVEAGSVVELGDAAAQPLIESGNLGPVDEVADATPETPAENPGEGSAAPSGDAPVADLGNPEVAQAPADAPVDGAPVADTPVGDQSVQNDAATDPVV